jgi:hypothetical protein
MRELVICTNCKGSGKIPKRFFRTEPCPVCKGTGRVPRIIPSTQSERIPPVVSSPPERRKERDDDNPVSTLGFIPLSDLPQEDGSGATATAAQPEPLTSEPFSGGESGNGGAGGSWPDESAKTAGPEPEATPETTTSPESEQEAPAAEPEPESPAQDTSEPSSGDN